MFTLILLSIVGFSLISFLPFSSTHTFYYLYLLDYLHQHFLIFSILFTCFYVYFKIRHHPSPFIYTLQINLIGFLGSLVFIYLLAFIELNLYARLSFVHLGAHTDIAQIQSTLLQHRLAPQIMAVDKSSKAAVYALTKASVGSHNYYGQHVLDRIPASLIIASPQNQPDVILIDNTLIISQISPSQIQQLSPILGYLLIQNYFTQLQIKSFPQVDLLTDSDYQQFRRQDFLDKLILVDQYQLATQDSLASYSAQLSQSRTQITDLKSQIQVLYDQLNQGVTSRDPLYAQVSLLNQQIDVLAQKVSDLENQYSEAQTLALFFESQKALGEKLIDNIPSERGAFYPDQIKLSLPDSSPHTIADYLTNLVHEYLHYASYVDNDHKLNNPFFEEGLTEFYARQIINRHLNIRTNLGYPVLNLIFTKLAKNLPDPDLLEIYFTKNQPALITLIDRVYGKEFYQNNANLFLAIQSTNDRAKLLPLANLLMSRIHGQPLTEQDLISTFTNY